MELDLFLCMRAGREVHINCSFCVYCEAWSHHQSARQAVGEERWMWLGPSTNRNLCHQSHLDAMGIMGCRKNTQRTHTCPVLGYARGGFDGSCRSCRSINLQISHSAHQLPHSDVLHCPSEPKTCDAISLLLFKSQHNVL